MTNYSSGALLNYVKACTGLKVVPPIISLVYHQGIKPYAQQIDLKNWRANQKNSGFLPEERAWLSEVLDQLGWVDVFRRINPDSEQYTWWSNRGQAWAKNVGWRIDYQIATPMIASTATQVSIYKSERFSDHAPLIIDYDYSL